MCGRNNCTAEPRIGDQPTERKYASDHLKTLSCRERLGYRPFDCSLSLRSKGYGKDFMLHYAIVFLIIALIAAFFGFAGVAGTSAWIAQLLFGIFLVLFVISLVFRGRPPV
jgi:uncharacterized membrane protein YtjA (UPF0391 family)